VAEEINSMRGSLKLELDKLVLGASQEIDEFTRKLFLEKAAIMDTEYSTFIKQRIAWKKTFLETQIKM